MQTAVGMCKMLRVSQGHLFLELILISSFPSTNSELWLDFSGSLVSLALPFRSQRDFRALCGHADRKQGVVFPPTPFHTQFLVWARSCPRRDFLNHTDIPEHQPEFVQKKAKEVRNQVSA